MCGLGLRQALSLEFFHCSGEQRRIMLADIMTIYLICVIPILSLLLVGHTWINYYFFANDATVKLIAVSLIIIFIYFFVELLYQVLQYQGKAQELTILQSSSALLTIGINLFLLYFVRLGVYSIIIGQLVGMSLVCLWALMSYHRAIPWSTINMRRSLSLMSAYLAQGLPFVPTVLFGWLLASGDRWALAQLTTLHHVGIYSVADTFGQLFQFVILIPFSNAYLPMLMTKFAQNPDKLLSIEQENKKVMWTCMAAITMLITLGYLCARPILYFLLPATYHEAITYIWLLLIGYIFLMGSYFAAGFIQFHKKRYFLAFALCIPALINIVLNFALIPYLQIYGCVLATVIAYAIYFFMMLWYNNRLGKRI